MFKIYYRNKKYENTLFSIKNVVLITIYNLKLSKINISKNVKTFSENFFLVLRETLNVYLNVSYKQIFNVHFNKMDYIIIDY